jgi:hypothetical protein
MYLPTDLSTYLYTSYVLTYLGYLSTYHNVEVRRHFSPDTIRTMRNEEAKIQGDCKDAGWSNNLGDISERFVGTDQARSGLWTAVRNIRCYRLWAFRRPGMGRLLVYSMNTSTFWHAEGENNKIGFWCQLLLCCCTWLVSLFRWAPDVMYFCI